MSAGRRNLYQSKGKLIQLQSGWRLFEQILKSSCCVWECCAPQAPRLRFGRSGLRGPWSLTYRLLRKPLLRVVTRVTSADEVASLLRALVQHQRDPAAARLQAAFAALLDALPAIVAQVWPPAAAPPAAAALGPDQTANSVLSLLRAGGDPAGSAAAPDRLALLGEWRRRSPTVGGRGPGCRRTGGPEWCGALCWYRLLC